MTDWRGELEVAFLRGIAAVEPERLVAEALTGQLPPIPGRITVVALGKAAAGMARGARLALGGEARGIVISPEPASIPGFEVIVGEHPIPGTGSFSAGRRLLEVAKDAGRHETLLVLISGGASALAEVPAPGVDPSSITCLNADLLRSGLSIREVNRSRTALSALKGGKLTESARPARVVTLAISDVPGSQPETIGSGPTVGGDAYHLIADGLTAATAVAEACRATGLEVALEPEPFGGIAASTGHRLAREALSSSPGSAIVTHGESTVTVDGEGRGGRNQELALAAATSLEGSPAILGALATDGIDGPTPNAGAIVDGTTVTRGREAGLDAATHLERHDSATFLEAVGDVLVTGPTGTNVADLVLAIKQPES